MNYGQVKGLDKPVSRLVQGAVEPSGENEAPGFALLDAAFAAGVNTLDTAHQYGDGANERLVGRWLASRGLREEVVLIGKGAHHSSERRRVTPGDITSDLLESLERFGTPYIDLYLLHRDDERVPVGPIVEVLNEHHAAGRIRAFGGSNWSHARVREANAYAEARGLVPFAASSPQLSLATQLKPPWQDCVSIGGDAAAQRYYRETGLALFTWSSLAGGFFSGRLAPDAAPTDEAEQLCLECYGSPENFSRLERAQRLAGEKGVTTPQIALAYVLNQPLNVFALVGARTPDEVRANAEAAELALSAADLAWLERG